MLISKSDPNHHPDEKIKRMKQAQINNADADFNRRIKELKSAINMADVTTQPVAFGLLRITKPE